MSTESFDIVPVEDMGSLDDDTMNSLVLHEGEVYGYRGFGEYLFCKDPKCRRIQSIDEVYGVSDTRESFVPLSELEKDGPSKPCCPECGEETMLVFDPSYFRDYLRGLFEGAHGALLMDSKGQVQGSTFVKPDTLESFFRNNMDYKETFDWEDFRGQVEKVLGMEAEADTKMLIWNRVSIGRQFRGGENFNDLVATALNIHPEMDKLPAFGATRFDSALYPIIIPIGFKGINSDELGTVTVGIKEVGDFRAALNMPFADFKAKFGDERRALIAKQKAQPPAEDGPKFYKGAKILDDLQLADERLRQKIEVYESADIPSETVLEVSKAFREVFANKYGYGQYAFYPSDGKPLSPQQVFGGDNYVDIGKLDAFDLGSLPNEKTGETPMFWHDPETTYKNLLSKLQKSGHLAIKRNPEGKIQAFTFGYSDTVKNAFTQEEWEDPLAYSEYRASEKRSLDTFIEKVNEAIRGQEEWSGYEELTPDEQVYIWNCFAAPPNEAGKGYMRAVARQLEATLPEDFKETRFCLLESVPGTKMHEIFLAAGAVDAPEALAENESSIMVAPLKKLTNYFGLSVKQ